MTGRKVGLVVALLLAVGLFAVPRAQAQVGLTYTSGIQVQNLGAATADIRIDFFSEDTGNALPNPVTDTVAAGANKTYFPLPTGAGFKGSAVISANQPIAAITNLVTPDFTYGGSATGLTGGSRSVGLPLIMRNNSGFTTFFSVQNAGTGDATVNVTYAPGTAGNAGVTEAAFTLKPGASRTFDQSSKTQLGDRFIGSATITANQDIVATVGQVGTTTIRTLLMYDGFNAGTTTVRAPLVMANNSGYFTSLNIQNVGTAAANVTVTYGANVAAGSTFAPQAQTLTLDPGKGGNLIQAAGQFGSNRYIGSATITSNQPIVAVVNQLRIGTPTTSQGTAYEGFNPSVLTAKASAPLIMANNGGYFTSVQCQNSGTAATNVTVTYSPNTAGTGTPPADTFTVAPGNTGVVIQAGRPAFAARYVGSATITATQPVACLVNELSQTGAGDAFLTYNAINY